MSVLDVGQVVSADGYQLNVVPARAKKAVSDADEITTNCLPSG
jgi:hypothetical protein